MWLEVKPTFDENKIAIYVKSIEVCKQKKK